MKVLVVGLTPEYYSSSVKTAVSGYQASMRSTNMGASFITRSIVSIFDADYVDIASEFDISEIKNNYDACIVSLASHLGPSRDVSQLVSFLKDADLRTIFLSGGLDAGQDGSENVHRSVRELLDLCSVDNNWIGVRGAASALYLHRQGIKNVVPIGCPTMYSNFAGEILPSGLESQNDIAVPFHWSIAVNLLDGLSNHKLIGQDVMDEELFLDNKSDRLSRNISEHLRVSQKEVQSKLEYAVSKGGFFPKSYQAWYEEIGAQKALLSGRLHAAICGLTQGVPTVLSSWDIRTHEIVDYFKIPSASGELIRKEGALSAFRNADFGGFNERQTVCWGRWAEFLNQNNIAQKSEGYYGSVAPISKSNFEADLQHDNEILRTASHLQSESSYGRLRQLNRALSLLRRSLKLVRRKTGLY